MQLLDHSHHQLGTEGAHWVSKLTSAGAAAAPAGPAVSYWFSCTAVFSSSFDIEDPGGDVVFFHHLEHLVADGVVGDGVSGRAGDGEKPVAHRVAFVVAGLVTEDGKELAFFLFDVVMKFADQAGELAVVARRVGIFGQQLAQYLLGVVVLRGAVLDLIVFLRLKFRDSRVDEGLFRLRMRGEQRLDLPQDRDGVRAFLLGLFEQLLEFTMLRPGSLSPNAPNAAGRLAAARSSSATVRGLLPGSVPESCFGLASALLAGALCRRQLSRAERCRPRGGRCVSLRAGEVHGTESTRRNRDPHPRSS